DVMRGEETQVFGAMDEEGQREIYILPGTHSKWVVTQEGRIEDFVTFMSGELFSVLKEHSILGRLMKGDEDHQESFDRGCSQALESPFGLLSQLFSARTMGLFQQVEEEGIHSFLSGLILGSELKEAFSRFSSRKEKEFPSLKLIGEGRLVESYQRAFQLAGHDCEMVSGTPTTVGLMKMARFASII
ncbi:MAG: 2-dehydro-3-deoxygalactonokinase, partial [Deltaproteobacteria bacterium]|nr:2-dehydro-3-deoxygalactonokinase [Deltaproteobacteria bacterium]